MSKGVLELPLQYIVAIIIAFLAVSAISLAFYKTWKKYKIEEAKTEIHKIINEGTIMASQAEEGTKKSLEINLGKEVNFVEIGENYIKIVMKWRENIFLSSNVKFRCEKIIYPGKKILNLELKKEDGEKYVEIQIEG
ncbi:MAG: hypothetical protein H5T45_05835 [Thermoplasmatales archaeon]|nr:hypothetical protein [Thermoplasmatales archaeon]